MTYNDALRLKKGHTVFVTMTGEQKCVKEIEVRDETRKNPKTIMVRTTDGYTYTHRSVMPFITQAIRERMIAREGEKVKGGEQE